MSVSGVCRDDLTPAVAGADAPSAADPPPGDPPAPDSVVEVMEEGGAAPVSGVPPSCEMVALSPRFCRKEGLTNLMNLPHRIAKVSCLIVPKAKLIWIP